MPVIKRLTWPFLPIAFEPHPDSEAARLIEMGLDDEFREIEQEVDNLEGHDWDNDEEFPF